MFQCNLKGFNRRLRRSFCSQVIQLAKNKFPLGSIFFFISRIISRNEFKKLCEIYHLLRRASFIYGQSCNDKGVDSACASRRRTNYPRSLSYIRSISYYHGLRKIACAQGCPACHLGVKRSRVTRTLETQAPNWWANPFFPLVLLSSAFVID